MFWIFTPSSASVRDLQERKAIYDFQKIPIVYIILNVSKM